jgi:hypothetical protein
LGEVSVFSYYYLTILFFNIIRLTPCNSPEDSKLRTVPAPLNTAAEKADLIITDRLQEFEVKKPQRGGVVAWSPPAPNWNPWTGCNIDEGPLSYTPLADISR